MAHAKKHKTSEDCCVVECLLFKLILSPTLVGEEREIEKGRSNQEFWDARKLFEKRDGEFNEG